MFAAQPMQMGMQMAPWQMCSLLDGALGAQGEVGYRGLRARSTGCAHAPNARLLTRTTTRFTGPDNFNIVLNGSPACCCCGPTPIHADLITQRAPSHLLGTPASGLLGAIERAIEGQMDGTQTVSFNNWVGTGAVPPHMVGRVDPAAVTELVSMLSVVEQSQQSCLTQCFTCSCAANARNLQEGIVAVGNACAPRLGSTSMQLMTYNYECVCAIHRSGSMRRVCSLRFPRRRALSLTHRYWVPPSQSTDGNGNTNYTPGHWQQASLQYVQVNMPPRMGQAPAMMQQQQQPMMVPGQPGYVQMNPMVMQ